MTLLLLTAVVASAWLLPTTEGGLCLPHHRVAHPRNCSRYIFCDDKGVPHGFACPPGLHFNKDKSWCDWPSNANCTHEDKSLRAKTRTGVRKDGTKFIIGHKSKTEQLNSTAYRAAELKMKGENKYSNRSTVMNKAKPKEERKKEPRMEVKWLGQGVEEASTNGYVDLDRSKTTVIKDKAEAAAVKHVKGKQEEKVNIGRNPQAHSISKREDKTEAKKEDKKVDNGKTNEDKVLIENKTLLNKPSDEGIKKITTLIKNDTLNESKVAENKAESRKNESKKEEVVVSESSITNHKSMNESLDEQVKKAVVVKNITFKDSRYNKKTFDVSNMTSTDINSDTNIPTYDSVLEALRKMYNNSDFDYFPVNMNSTDLGYGFGEGEASTENVPSEISSITDNPLKNDSDDKSESLPEIEISSTEIPVTIGNASSVVKVPLTESAPKIEKVTKNEDITSSKSSPSTTAVPTTK